MSETVYGGNQVQSLPKPMPCGHVPHVHFTSSGKYVVILMGRITHPDTYVDIDPTVWCDQCGWVKITDEDFAYYQEFDGAQEPNRPNSRG